MGRLSLIFLSSLPWLCLCGPNDTLDQLVAAVSNVRVEDQALHEPVTRERGELPTWLSGTLVRHACGVFGEMENPSSKFVNRVTHIFDCIEMGQSYHFHQNEVTFSSQFYDTNRLDIWMSYEENMNTSSIWWGTVYALKNHTAIAKENDNSHKPGKHSEVPAVAWWQIGNEVVATTEHPGGIVVDPHNLIAFEDYPFSNGDWLGEGFHSITNPAHEGYGGDGVIWSTVAAKKKEGKVLTSKRLVYKVEPLTARRTVIAEISYPDANLTWCEEHKGERYHDNKARIGNIHSVQTTERYIILVENAYLYDPCEHVNYNDSLPHYINQMSYESEAENRIHIIDKCGDVETINVPAFLITHVLGSFEDLATNLIHFDALQYEDASPYVTWSNTDVMTSGEERADNFTQVTRYTVNMKDWTLLETKNLVTDPDIRQDFEFCNINPAYYGRPYKYAYMTQNVYALNGAMIKLNVDTGEVIRKELPDGLFPTEPIFAADPEGTEEDDGVILMSGVDGDKEKGFIMVYNASNMEELYYGTAPKKTLLGLHSKFYPFHVGCSQDDCTPHSSSSEPPNNGAGKFTAPGNWVFNIILVIPIMVTNQMIH